MAKATDLLLEYRQEGRKIWAIRFYGNGQVKEYSDSEMTFEDGKIVTHERPLAWRALTKLTPEGLEKLLAALRKADLFSLPNRLGDPNRLKDGTQFSWKINLDGKQKTVLAYGPEASSSPELKNLGDLIQELTADAFEADSGDENQDT